ncbi:MAG TPA: hypothetical protein DD384_03220 [Firmicutes bacterium]|nr:hypothetical protein [Bacillota bacterium]
MTFEWKNAKEVMPTTKNGYSQLLLIAYKSEGNFVENESGFDYAIGNYKSQGNRVVSRYIYDDVTIKDWEDVMYWSYFSVIKSKMDTEETKKKRINKVAEYIDKYTDACQDCPAWRECKEDTISCKGHIIKYLRGD